MVRSVNRLLTTSIGALLLVASPLLALAEEPHSESLHQSLRTLLERGEYRQLQRAADAAVKADPKSVVGWQHLGYALQRLGQPLGARRAYETVIELSPEDAWTLAQLGHLLGQAGEREGAAKVLRRSLRLEPSSLETWRKLTTVLRDGGQYAVAAEAIEDALDAGIDPAWSFAELGYVQWAAGEPASSLGAWSLARKTGADAAACDYGEKLARWEFAANARAGEEAAFALRKQRLEGPRWSLRVGGLLVRTRLGPDIPPDLRDILEDMPARYEKFLQLSDLPYEPLTLVRVDLARTLEEHEELRRERFPGGRTGQAYLESLRRDFRGARRDGRGDGRGGPAWEIHVCAALPGARTGLSHELVHALLHSRHRFLPVWVDEGLATHLELRPGGSLTVSAGRVRKDLLTTLRKALERGETQSLGDLLIAPRAEFEGPLGRARYAQAWSLVHFLLRPEQGGRKKLLRFLDHVGSPNPERGNISSFRAVYGNDFDKLEAAWRKHVDALFAR